ncbi:hypothetical protein [Yinghuangia sp. YIM S10712]|uniref:hypothetical protein n=1 Tax=Yinghuangia sp. YIM S10712 TaxID=3436930 RepID=UPI003F52CE5F
MTWITDDIIERAERFVWTTARVLEQRRFAWHFRGGGGGPGGVLDALDAYRTADGGYAYGLEPDVRGPAPQPATLRAAVPILAETGALADTRTAALCDWLAGVTEPDGGVPAALPTLRPYPHPPWVRIPDHLQSGLLPTGWIVGPMLVADVLHPWVAGASDFCRGAINALTETRAETHPYEVHAALAYLEGAPDRLWARDQAALLGEMVREQRLVVLDPTHREQARIPPGYAPGEYHYPYDYAPSPDSLARSWFSETEMQNSFTHLVNAQEEDGGWPIRWAEWAPTIRAESRPMVTLEALLTLRAYSK